MLVAARKNSASDWRSPGWNCTLKKIRLPEFVRSAARHRDRWGQCKSETFDFPGFAHR